MHIHRRERVQERRLPTPPWVNNNEVLREEVLKAVEKRYYIGPGNRDHVPGQTSQERFARIRQIERMHLKRWLVVLQRLRERYRTEPEETRPEATQLQNVDTQCCLMQRGIVAITAAVVYFYYHLGYSSVEVAQELHLKPPHVRQILARLLHAASGISQINWAKPPRSGPDFDLMMQWHREGMPLNELTTRLRLLGYDPLKVSTVYRVLENTKQAHFQKLVEQVAEAESIFARIPLKKPRTAEHRKKLSDNHKIRWASPGFRDATVDAMRAVGKRRPYKPRTAEHRAKLSAAVAASYATGKRGRSVPPEIVAKRSVGQKSHWATLTPERRAERAASIRAGWARRKAAGKVAKPQSPEARAKQRESLKASWARGAFANRKPPRKRKFV